jgi:hypothetical protein
MKADRCGTWAEQKMFHYGYQTASERPQCGNCKHHETTFVKPGSIYETERYKCMLIGCGVTKNAICKEWEAR